MKPIRAFARSDCRCRDPRRHGAACWLLGALGAWAEPALAATINVPADQPTVQAAAAAATSGDVILIAPGTHPGGAYIDHKHLTFASWYATTSDTSYIAQTVLSGVTGDPCGGDLGCAGDAVLEFGGDANGSAVIGLTVTGGGKGVRTHSMVDVSYCHVLSNGDGVNYLQGSGGTISNSLFAHNGDDGVDLNDDVQALVTHNIIRENHQDGVEFRMYAYSGAPLHIDFIDNWISGNGGDGIQLIDYPDPSDRVITMRGNVFDDNAEAAVGCMGDGQTSEDYSGSPITERVLLVNNTFISSTYGFVGGANTIALNNVFVGTQFSALRRVGGNSIASYNLFWGNGLDAEDSNVDPAHTLVADPLLEADLTLGAGSPAIDAGTPFFQWMGETVLDLPPTAYFGSAPDLGAYERIVSPLTAARDTATVDEGGTIEVPAPGVLDNDSDTGGNPLTVSALVTPPAHGAVTLHPDGSYEYTHDGSELPVDSFAYEVDNGQGNTARATVSIGVLPINDPPVVVDDLLLAPANGTGTLLDVLRNDLDPDAGDSVGLTAVSLQGATGVATILGDMIQYTPTPGFVGYDTFGYTAQDLSGATASGRATVRVDAMNVIPVTVAVSAGSDDAEEVATGTISRVSTDLELVFDGSNQTVGTRFAGLSIPRGAQIAAAYVQFKADETQSEATSLTIRAQASDDPATFAFAAYDISSRPCAARSVAWNPPPWTTIGAAGVDERTPDLTGIVSQIVGRPGWASGNALALIFTGTGHRTAESFEGDPGAPTLHVEYLEAATPPPTAVEETRPSAIALSVLGPSPARGSLRLSIRLPDRAPASLDLLDVAGRRVASREVGTLGPGRHSIELRERLAAGVYLVRLAQGGRSCATKVVVLE